MTKTKNKTLKKPSCGLQCLIHLKGLASNKTFAGMPSCGVLIQCVTHHCSTFTTLGKGFTTDN